MICNAELCPNYFSVGVSVPAVVFHRQFWKTDNFGWNCWFFEDCRRNTIASKETFTENLLRRNFTLHFTSYLSIALSKILPHSKTIKTLRNCQYLVKTTLAVYLIFYKFKFFGIFIIFLESAIKFITGIFDFRK